MGRSEIDMTIVDDIDRRVAIFEGLIIGFGIVLGLTLIAIGLKLFIK